MREIKFRYGYADGKNWIFEVFNLDQIEYGESYDVLSYNPLLRNYKLTSRDQFTGLKDKNGKEIYEGDIVKLACDNFDNEETGHTVVFGTFSHETDNWGCETIVTGFHVKFKDKSGYCNIPKEIEIIGNIYENPELLP